VVVAALGDSLSGGSFIDGRYVDDPSASYPALVAERIHATRLGIVGIAGAVIQTIVESIGQLPRDADLLLVNAGTNDMVVVADGLDSLEQIRTNFDAMIALSRSWMPKARIVIVGLRDVACMDPDQMAGPHAIRRLRNAAEMHAAVRAFNEHILATPAATPVDLASREGSESVALFPDAIHPSPLGVRWIADAVLAAL
jgi:lysophospholipase L1-like esterase